MKFQYYRYFLSPINRQLGLFDKDISRSAVVSEIFETDYDLEDYKSQCAYKFNKKVDNIIYTRIGKHSLINRNLPPNENYESECLEHWPYCNVFININDNPEVGQIIAFEYKSSVFKEPVNFLRRWADYINIGIAKYGYSLSINPINTTEDFWSVVNEYKGQIKEVSFSFSSPNLFNLQNTLETELKEANKIYNAESSGIMFKNEQGALNIPEDNILINQSVQYTTKGGGDYKIKTTDGNIKTSIKKIKVKDIEIDGLEFDNQNDFKYFVDKLFEM